MYHVRPTILVRVLAMGLRGVGKRCGRDLIARRWKLHDVIASVAEHVRGKGAVIVPFGPWPDNALFVAGGQPEDVLAPRLGVLAMAARTGLPSARH